MLDNVKEYRCYVKDQLYLTEAPKAFMRVDSFNVKIDLLTNANSTITVMETAGNIDNGDILVLYDETGKTVYQGVIKSIEDTKITCSQMQSFYKGKFIYHVSPSSSLEREISNIMNEYARGEIYQSTWTDPLVAQRLGGITIQYTASTQAKLPTDTDKDGNENFTVTEMETWIYSLYEQYGIVFDFTINYSGQNYVRIWVPTYDTLKVSNNTYSITNMSPITTVEETNRLCIYSKEKVYRRSYVATTSGIKKENSNIANRFKVTNTVFVFSDDALADLIAAYLPNTMYNHKLTFTLIVKNYVYEFDKFKLGGPLDVWIGEDFFSTVFTGYEISKKSNENVSSINMTCGLVRTALTKKLTLGKV